MNGPKDVNTDAKRKAQNYYTSCMDPNGTIESLGGKPLLEMLRTHLVGWHLLQRLPPPTAPAEDPTELSQQDQGFLKYSLMFLVSNFLLFIKFRYSEKATKFLKEFTLCFDKISKQSGRFLKLCGLLTMSELYNNL